MHVKPLSSLTPFLISGKKFRLPSGETYDSLRQQQCMNANKEVPKNGIQKPVPTRNADTSTKNISLFGEDWGD
jgi:hypothetical protein